VRCDATGDIAPGRGRVAGTMGGLLEEELVLQEGDPS
jgi:hypothetical protein